MPSRLKAEIIARVIADPSLRRDIVKSQKARLLDFGIDRVAERLAEALEAVGARSQGEGGS